MLCANIELAERTEESADDMTAAEIAPRPTNDMPIGVRYCRTRGNVSRLSAIRPALSRNVEFGMMDAQSVNIRAKVIGR